MLPARNYWDPIRFVVKHAVAATVVVSGAVILTAASYFALLAWAVVAGGGLGGPLAFPFMVLFALLASTAAVLLVLLPTTALTEWICRKRQAHRLIQIPVATLVLAAYVLAATVVIALLAKSSVGKATSLAAVTIGVLLVPLGAYWWSLQSTDWLIHVGIRLWGRIKSA